MFNYTTNIFIVRKTALKLKDSLLKSEHDNPNYKTACKSAVSMRIALIWLSRQNIPHHNIFNTTTMTYKPFSHHRYGGL